MNTKESIKEILVIIFATLILAITISFKNNSIFYKAALIFLIIISVNVAIKKIVGYYFETNVRTKFWTWYQYGFRKDFHFKSPIPMAWLPLVLGLISKGFVQWLGILEFDVEAKTERVSKRHGLYRFSEVTEWHMGWIATWAIITNLIIAGFAYIAGFELFTKLSIYFVAWSIIPLARFDGAKIIYASRLLWTTLLATTTFLLFWGLTTI